MKKKETHRVEINLLGLFPVRNIGWEKNPEGLVVLLKPKFKHPIFQKHIIPRLKNPHYKIRLDDVGSCVWESCSGELTVKELGEILQVRFGEKVEPLYDRLAIFLKSLERSRFITFKGL